MTAAYDRWVAAGKPLQPCRPIREFVGLLEQAFPVAASAHLFSWFTNDAHLLADPPEDHTPFSATGWPTATPFGIVTATDVMHRVDLGVDCAQLVPYWLAECKAGRMRWVKYINWQGKRYDVRNGWAGVPTVGHFDHAHLSARTDNLDTTLAGWSITPEDAMTLSAEQSAQLAEVHSILMTGKRLGPAQTSDGGIPIAWLPRQFYEVDNAQAAVAAAVSALTGEGSVDVDALASALKTELGEALAADLAARLAQ